MTLVKFQLFAHSDEHPVGRDKLIKEIHKTVKNSERDISINFVFH